MSRDPRKLGGSPVPRETEPEAVRGPRVFATGAVGVVVVALCVIVADHLAGGASGRAETNARRAPRAAPRAIGSVDPSLFDAAALGIALREKQKAALREYGWADRDAGVATIPIDRAIDLVVQRGW